MSRLSTASLVVAASFAGALAFTAPATAAAGTISYDVETLTTTFAPAETQRTTIENPAPGRCYDLPARTQDDRSVTAIRNFQNDTGRYVFFINKPCATYQPTDEKVHVDIAGPGWIQREVTSEAKAFYVQ
ncbi:hypothetical protein LZ318_02555 [Saccharopolyspora indica]|uniref:hypothetical protein n=1 Tax=Saccharopolyspora indica TaxID=1229659 RepID=UPI0022EB3A00|nr:hypothetical protein [Saccharopolyspora indica]MDA3649999.1 hypothetical protein [Saccharopolyspora indica]